MSFNVKSEILASIAKTEDQTVKSLLLLMLGVLEEIGGKIDSVINDERSLRETVLNGHSDVHPKHHEWIAEQMQKEEQNGGSLRNIRDGVIEKIIWIGLTAVGTSIYWNR